MMDINIFDNELWESSGYYIVTIATSNNLYIDNGTPFFFENPVAAEKPLNTPKKP